MDALLRDGGQCPLCPLSILTIDNERNHVMSKYSDLDSVIQNQN